MTHFTGDLLGLACVFVLVLVNGFFVAAEFALVSVRKTRIDTLANEGSRAAVQVQKALSRLDTCIAGTQLGVTMASLALGSLGEPTMAHLVEPLFRFLPVEGRIITSHGVAITVGFALVTSLHIILGELVPKSIAFQRADGAALRLIPPLNIFLTVFRPFIYVLNRTGNFVLRRIGLDPVAGHGAVHSVEELELLVHSTTESGALDRQQEQMVSGVFDFKDTVVRKVMTSRLDVTAIEASIRTEELLRVVIESGHSRLPVYEESLDNIIGIVHVKDVIQDVADGTMDSTLRELMRPPFFVPENKRASFLLAELRRRQMQMAVVRDEYGVVSGLVTIEDLLEEIVGDILDEYDVEETQMTQIDAETWVVDGTMRVDDFNERMETELPTEDADTLGGFVFSNLGHQPEVNEAVAYDGITLYVEATDGRRVQKVRVIKSPRVNDEAQGTVSEN